MFDSTEKNLNPFRRTKLAEGVVRRRNESGENQLKIAEIIGEARKLGKTHGLRSKEAAEKSKELDPLYAREDRNKRQIERVEALLKP